MANIVRLCILAFLILLLISFYLAGLNIPVAIIVVGILLAPKIKLEEVTILYKNLTSTASWLINTKFPHALLFVSFLLVAYTYRNAFGSYFEGDEWYWMWKLTPVIQDENWVVKSLISSFIQRDLTNPHLIPLADLYQVAQFKYFKIDYSLYVIASLFLHSINSFLVGYFILQLSKSKKIAFVVALLFAVNTGHSQAVTWMATAINSQPSLLFGLLSLIYMKKHLISGKSKQLLASSIFLLCSLWSKETGVIFLGMVLLLYFSRHRLQFDVFFKELKSYTSVLIIFFITQYIHVFQNKASLYKLSMSQSPWIYSIFSIFDKVDLSLILFRFFSFLLKALPQSLFSAHFITNIGVWLTQMQFPYFNQEKVVRGTNYLMFIQTAMPELVSYLFGIIFIFLLLSLYKRKHLKSQVTFIFWSLVLAIIPILLITIKFSWWGYTSIIDARHFYHFSFLTITVIVLFLDETSKVIEKYLQMKRNSVFIVVSVALLLTNSVAVNKKILEQQRTTLSDDRRMIISVMQERLKTVKPKTIIYSISNKSYYGFASLMLPYQTPFYSMIPVLFSENMHNNGLRYPESFYSDAYQSSSSGTLAGQGYFEDGEYGLGYFLDEVTLIKTLEKKSYTEDIVFAFTFNGDEHSFRDTTIVFRNRLSEKLAQRQIFQDWIRYGSEKDYFSFQAKPSWSVDKENKKYLVKDEKGAPVLQIEAFDNDQNVQFSTFVKEYLEDYYQLENASYETKIMQPDLDIQKIIYHHSSVPNVIFLVAGNNLQFYKITIKDIEKAELIFRTFEFIDDAYDVINL